MKRNCEQLRRLQPEIPSFHTLLRRADATLLLISGHTREALPGLEACLAEPPREIVGWVRAHASLARAYNELGEHQRAREVVESVRARVPPDDLTFPMQHLSLHIEGALAEAGLGNYQAATAQLEHWMQRYQSSDVPLTRGALHEARARVALMEGDMPAFERHLRRMQNWYLPTALPELVQRCQRLAKQRPPSVGLAHAQVFGAAS